ncbi:MAG: DUF2809 domain-containing protein [Aureispira sp.]|nr:DUF2809 domain-containing protein [Aureispira sp.]
MSNIILTVERNRIVYVFLIIATIGLGLLSRSSWVPAYIYAYLGDALYALMIYFIVGWCLSKNKIENVVIISLVICFLIEFSQLCHFEWLDTLRQNRLGRLVLGRGFLWTDLIAYTMGVLLGGLLEMLYYKRLSKKS